MTVTSTSISTTPSTSTSPGTQAPGDRQRRRLSFRLLLVAAVVLAAVGILAAAGLRGNLVYYRTTSELAADPSLQGDRVRLGGLVVAGSVQRTPDGVSFLISDGVQDIRVVNAGQPRGVFTEGQGALVEGVYDSTGVFRSDLLLVKHSNQYRARDGKPYVPPVQPR